MNSDGSSERGMADGCPIEDSGYKNAEIKN